MLAVVHTLPRRGLGVERRGQLPKISVSQQQETQQENCSDRDHRTGQTAGRRFHDPPGSAMRGANAAVVGILGAALYSPVWTSTIIVPLDFALALAGFLLLTARKIPPWIVVALLVVTCVILKLA
jgi:hypothetical protein